MSKTKREINLYLDDIKTCLKNIEKYTKGLSLKEFRNNKMVIDAVVRNVEIIGEAANNIPKEVKLKYSNIPWRKIISMRNKVVHEYFGVDEDILWKTIKEDLPILKKKIAKL